MNMSKNEALSILKASETEDIEEAYEQLLFDWKQKYLSTIPPVQLIRSHIKKIERLNEAAEHFLSFPNTEDMLTNEIDIDQNLESYLTEYQPILMQLKLQISSVAEGFQLIKLLNQLIQLEHNMVAKLIQYSPEINEADLVDVKLSSPNDFHQVKKELLEKEISETEIKNYLRTELRFGHFPHQSFLLNAVLKAVKQDQGGGN